MCDKKAEKDEDDGQGLAQLMDSSSGSPTVSTTKDTTIDIGDADGLNDDDAPYFDDEEAVDDADEDD